MAGIEFVVYLRAPASLIDQLSVWLVWSCCLELSIAGPSFIVRSRRTICGFQAPFGSLPVVVEDRRSSGVVRVCSAICSLCEMVEAVLLFSRPIFICGRY